MYFVEIIKWGRRPIFPFGVFYDFNAIEDAMLEYNYIRGGKYPVYLVREMREDGECRRIPFGPVRKFVIKMHESPTETDHYGTVTEVKNEIPDAK